MAYFPIFTDLEGKKCRIVGSGDEAQKKAETLAAFGAQVSVSSSEPDGEALDNCELVVLCFEDEGARKRISARCRERRIPINSVDDIGNCSFIFPALVKRKDLVIGISSGGKSPAAAVHIKNSIENMLPGGIDDILDYLARLRPLIKERIADAKTRAEVFGELFSACLMCSRPLTKAETETVISENYSDDIVM